MAQSKTPELVEDKLLPPESFNTTTINVHGNERYGKEGFNVASKKEPVPKSSMR
jgi:hypothetical protein